MGCVFRKILVIYILIFSPCSYANDMIGNTAVGYVGGSIIQTAEDGSINEINVGSIESESAFNVNVSGYVEGNIVVHTGRAETVRLNIGSYGGKN